MKNLQINSQSVGQQGYNLVEKVADDINIYAEQTIPEVDLAWVAEPSLAFFLIQQLWLMVNFLSIQVTPYYG